MRDAALEEFAERGAGASVRSVAARAGVSPGVVQHHFGTKQALREACDDYVVDHVRRVALEGLTEEGAGERDYLSALLVEVAPVARYLGRALGDGTAAAAALFEELVTVAETYLAGLPDAPTGQVLRDRALVLTAMRLGPVLLAEQLLRGMDLAAWDTTAAARTGAASLAVLHPDLLPAQTRQQVQAWLADSHQPTGEEPR